MGRRRIKPKPIIHILRLAEIKPAGVAIRRPRRGDPEIASLRSQRQEMPHLAMTGLPSSREGRRPTRRSPDCVAALAMTGNAAPRNDRFAVVARRPKADAAISRLRRCARNDRKCRTSQ
jgi:hypothetical protein